MKTPSPFLHPAAAPDATMTQMAPLGYGYGQMEGMPIALGDLDVEFNLNGFECGDDQANYAQGFTYDPSSGMYMAYDWSMQFNGCQPVMVNADGSIVEDYQCMSMVPNNGGSAEQLLAALGEKLAAGKGLDGDANSMFLPGYDENGCPISEVAGAQCDLL